MAKKLLYLGLTVATLCLGGNASAALVARWTFNNNPNDQVAALSWTLNGGATYATDSKEGEAALRCDGKDGYASLPGAGLLGNAFSVKTVLLWFKPDALTGTQVLFDEGGTSHGLGLRINKGTLEAAVRANSVSVAVTTLLSNTDWTHAGLSFNGGTLKLYLNGVEVASSMTTFSMVPSHTNVAGLGARNSQDVFGGTATGDYFGGLIDDVQMYDNAPTAAQIGQAMLNWPKARDPSPKDGAQNVQTPMFQWTAGTGAQWHAVYLGTSPDLGPADLVGPHQPVAAYWHFGTLTPGVTYYWRVDEVSHDGATVVPGDVWSFTWASLKAWSPVPADGATYVDPNVTLTWQVGLSAVAHDVYLGTDKAAVTSGAAPTFKSNQTATSFPAGLLQPGTRYYWRIDEVNSTGAKVEGQVWTFQTVPQFAVTDPNLAAWWTLDEGFGTHVYDWSGHGHTGDFVGTSMKWVDGYDGNALVFGAASNEYVLISGYPGVVGTHDRTCCAWIKTGGLGAIFSWGLDVAGQKWVFRVQNNNGTAGALRIEVNGGRIVGSTDLRDRQWHHVAAVLQSAGAPAVQDIKLYVDGRLEAVSDSQAASITTAGRNVWIGNDHNNRPFPGLIDDARIYDKGLTADELARVMRVDPLRASAPQPARGTLADIRTATPLTWTAGDNAARHDVYFGTEAAAVADANTSDKTGIYRGRSDTTTFTPAEDLAWGQTYFWRVDEVGADGSITPGRVWTFTVANYLVVDDFESYDEDNNRIYDAWIDGASDGKSGSYVGYNPTAAELAAGTGHFAERVVVYSGKQSLPMDYNNVAAPYFSEATRTFSLVQDWTFGGADTLVVHFQGVPPDFVSAAGTFTLTAAGTDIWNATDECRYVYERLTGDGSIIACVDSVTNSNAWAKAGVMIRETLAPDSRQAMVVVTPGNGVAFQRRQASAGTSVGTTEAGITAPHWVKLTRTGNLLTAQHSADGVTWGDVVNTTNPTSDTIVMTGTIYLGLALTGHAAGVPCTAVFSHVQTTGNVTGSWQQAEIGVDHPGNNPQGLYVGLEDGTGKAAFVAHPDPAATTLAAWTEWAIPLSSFPGVNPAKIKTIHFGVGDRKNPVPGGAGRVYLDDIRITRGPTAP